MLFTLLFLTLTLGVIWLFAGKILTQPGKLAVKLSIHTGVGLIILWVVDLVGAAVGFNIPLNFFTVMVTGLLGLPGLAMLGILRFIV